MTGTLDGAVPERPAFRLIQGDGEPAAAGRQATAWTHDFPISIMLRGHLVVDLFKATIDAERTNHTRGKSGLDMLFAALEVVFEAVKADTSEVRPPYIVTDVFEDGGLPAATAQVFTPVAPPDPTRGG